MPKRLSRCLSGAMLVAWLLGWTGGVRAAQASPLPWDEYWDLVAETRSLVVSLQGAPAEIAHQALIAAAERLEGVTTVTLPSGAAAPVDHGRLASLLRADPAPLADLTQLLDALLAARDAWPAQATAPDHAERLADILARPEFQWQPESPSRFAEWWQRLWERVWDLLARLGGDRSAAVNSSLLQLAPTVLGVLTLALVLGYVLRGTLSGFVSEAEVASPAAEGDEGLTSEAALKRAQALSAGGDYRAAVRYLYLSTLLLLEERGRLPLDRSLTNREVVRGVAHLPQLAASLAPVVKVFDRAWYGCQPVDEAAYDRYAAHVAEVRRQA